MDVFSIEEGYIMIKYQEDCQSCYLCVYECPSGAIRVDPQRPVDVFDVYDREFCENR
ncbi:MAG TPA: 4Fe-4S binding protein [Clostridia bacterium]|nr:4Fe-4S binding protein [Clostridia bacterium]